MNIPQPLPLNRFFSLAMVGVLLGGPLFAESASDSATPASQLRETAKACRDFSARLALGLAEVESCSEEIAQLTKHGDKLLAALAVSDPALLEWRTEVEEAAASAVRAVFDAKAAACRQFVRQEEQEEDEDEAENDEPSAPRVITIDPWAGPDQECRYYPERLGPITANWEGVQLYEKDLGRLPEHIPARYRLAEALGVGRNRLHVDLQWIDPELMRRKTEGQWGIHIFARLSCLVRGRFVATENENESNSPLPPIETFRVLVSSKGFMNIATNRFGEDLGNPLAYRTEMNRIGSSLSGRRRESPWFGENLAAAAAERGSFLQPAQPASTSEDAHDWIEKAVARKLAERRNNVAEAVRRDSGVIAAMQSLDDLLATFGAKLDAAPPLPALEPLRDRFPALAATSSLIAHGNLSDDALRRSPRLVRNGMDSAARSSWTSASPPAVRGDAAHLAQALDALQAWTLR